MRSQLQTLIESALALPHAERVELVNALIASLPEDEQIVLKDAFAQELERQCDEIDSGTARLIPWHKQILDKRMAALEADPEAGSSWEDVEARLRSDS
jgi:putative addiction module component (TIGR02574 family)